MKPRKPTREEIAAGAFITAKDAAVRLGVAPREIYRLMDRGDLAYLRPGGKMRRVSVVSLEYHVDCRLVIRDAA